LLKTGFFRQVRELKIQSKNPGKCFTDEETLIRMKAGAQVPEKVT
jgi:hypothetical protein